jgi:alkaline phosphatase
LFPYFYPATTLFFQKSLINFIGWISRKKQQMKVLTSFFICSVAIILLEGCSASKPVALPDAPMAERPKNIILLIGDGMGLSQITAALYSNNNHLNLETMPFIGFHKTYSSDDLVTDSAAGATAFASGIKTYNNAIGLNKDSLPVKTILEEAKEFGLAAGLIATSTIVHATPAAFAAHAKSREYYEEIASDMAESNVDLLIGGGKKYFDRREYDNRDITKELTQKGYRISDYSQEDIITAKFDPAKPLIFFTADKQPLTVTAGRDYLPLATRKALNFLEKRSDKGFFLMVEGSQIDWACHANDAKLSIRETLDFDKAVGEALAFARSHGNTLVIVTADHETGGLSVIEVSKMNRLECAFTTINHTATMVPVFAFGPMAQQFAGIFENTAIYKKMRAAFGFPEVQTSATSSYQK